VAQELMDMWVLKRIWPSQRPEGLRPCRRLPRRRRWCPLRASACS